VDNSTPITLTSPFQGRDYNFNPRFSAFIGFVLHGYAHTTLGFFARAFAHSRSITSAFSTSVSRRRMNILRDKRPRGNRAAEKRYELAAFQSIELHLLPQPGKFESSIPNWRGSVRR
jgi:hypothetical protein